MIKSMIESDAPRKNFKKMEVQNFKIMVYIVSDLYIWLLFMNL